MTSEALFSQYEAWREANGLSPFPIRRLEHGVFELPAWSSLPLGDGDAGQHALHSLGQSPVADEGDFGGDAIGFWRTVTLRNQQVLGLGKDVTEHGDRVTELQTEVGQHLTGKSFLHRKAALQKVDLFGGIHRFISLIGRAIKAAFRGRVE